MAGNRGALVFHPDDAGSAGGAPGGGRLVVVLCGPAGAGKTTAARASGLTVYDRDDAHWTSDDHFTGALAGLAGDRAARAVVIRAAATSSARGKVAALVQATHVYLLTAPAGELGRRVAHRDRADVRSGLASIGSWFDRHDRADGVQPFPGWDAIGPPNVTPAPAPARPAPTAPLTTSRRW